MVSTAEVGKLQRHADYAQSRRRLGIGTIAVRYLQLVQDDQLNRICTMSVSVNGSLNVLY